MPAKSDPNTLRLDDFEDGNLALREHHSLLGQWYTYEQRVGDHQLSIGTVAPPRLGSTRAIYTSGTDHGDWAGIGAPLNYGCVYDASRYVGVHFWIRGNSAPINVALITPGVIPVSQGGTCTKDEEGLCWDAYRSRVAVDEQWREVFVPFDSFAQLGYGPDAGSLDLTRLEAIQFQSPSSDFEYWIDDMSFYTEEVYTPFDGGTWPETANDSDSTQPPSSETSDMGDESRATATTDTAPTDIAIDGGLR